MEVLQSAPFVRLRSCHRSLYLAADKNGRDICLVGGRAAANTVWAVHVVADADGEPAVLFKSTYDGYLLATDLPATIGPSGATKVIQVKYGPGNLSPMPSMMWKVVRRQEAFLIKNSVGGFLRANGRYLRWRTMVTVAGDNSSGMMLWTIVPIDLERPYSLDAPSKESALQLIVAEIAEKTSGKQKLQARLHGISRRMEELQVERKKLQGVEDASLLSSNMQKMERATKTHIALTLKIATLREDISKVQERRMELEENISRARVPRRWSW